MIIITRVKEAVEEFIKVLRYGKDDIQTADQYGPAGIDSKPVKEQLALYASTGNKGESVILGYLNNSSETNEGETSIFATNSDGVEVFRIYLKNDGTVEFGGSDDYLVRFNELKSGFDTLTQDLNNLITAYNSHVHITTATVGATAVPGVLSPTVSTGTPSTATIDSSRIDEMKTL